MNDNRLIFKTNKIELIRKGKWRYGGCFCFGVLREKTIDYEDVFHSGDVCQLQLYLYFVWELKDEVFEFLGQLVQIIINYIFFNSTPLFLHPWNYCVRTLLLPSIKLIKWGFNLFLLPFLCIPSYLLTMGIIIIIYLILYLIFFNSQTRIIYQIILK